MLFDSVTTASPAAEAARLPPWDAATHVWIEATCVLLQICIRDRDDASWIPDNGIWTCKAPSPEKGKAKKKKKTEK